jgi:hypothetical protein
MMMVRVMMGMAMRGMMLCRRRLGLGLERGKTNGRQRQH